MNEFHETIMKAYLNVELPEITSSDLWEVKWTKGPLNVPSGGISLPIFDEKFAKMLKDAVSTDEADLTRARQA